MLAKQTRHMVYGEFGPVIEQGKISCKMGVRKYISVPSSAEDSLGNTGHI